MKWIAILFIFELLVLSRAKLAGPFLLWGQQKLQNFKKLSSPTEVNEQSLSTLFTEPKAIIVFIRNNTSRLDGINYPKFRQMISKNHWILLSQHILSVEPFHYNTNVQVRNLSGSVSEQDIELTSVFENSVQINGDGEVLGILAYLEFDEALKGSKQKHSKPNMNAATETSFIYRAPGKAILYTKIDTLLSKEMNQKQKSIQERTFSDRNDFSHLDIGFRVNNTSLRLRFNFSMLPSKFWSLSSMELDYKDYHNVMPPLVGSEVIAPRGSPLRCSTRSLFFRQENVALTLNGVQVQAWLDKFNSFGDAYDGIGYRITNGGLFEITLLVEVILIGIAKLMNLMPSNSFSKQLIFNVLE